VDFRTHGGLRSVESFEYRVVLSEVRGFLAELKRIAAEDDEFLRPRLPQYSRDNDPEAVGMKERARLGVGINEQLSWKTGEAFRRWRAIIEKQGISVFLKKYPASDSRGFSLFEDAATPAIVINKNEDADAARSFSVLHEYAHLLIRQPGISDHDNRNPVEAFCNRFAAAFLMPDAALRKLLPYWPNEPVDWTFEQVTAWAKALKVSKAALALRLEQASLAPTGFFGRYNRPNAPLAVKRDSPVIVNPVTVRLFELGGNYPKAVLGAYDRGSISEITAVQALGLSPEYIENARASVARHRALAGE
jgi:Zn-dependent peptidase ImmA (M78 family)